ncbi:MAG: cupin domain-containing protein [Elusimicrobia bacterium]|nr:cupin domain-containing protein [Elusimicrobiota bacterium]
MKKTKKHTRLKSSNLKWVDFATMKFQSLVGAGCTDRFAVYRIVIAKHRKVPRSYHKIAEELLVFLKGHGIAHVGRSKFKVAAGDTLFIRPGTPHGFITGAGPLELVAFLSPKVDAKTDFYYIR